ncbi:MAG TPA: hypothetical protein PLW02_09885, partial [Verrucomicrobiota bacterium]|nr:hypothetical protein [Verrucomicrobiota bacterium]
MPGTVGTPGTPEGVVRDGGKVDVEAGLTGVRTAAAGFVVAVGNLTALVGCGTPGMLVIVVVLGKTGLMGTFVDGLGAVLIVFDCCDVGAFVLILGILAGIDGKDGKFVVCESACQ